MLFRSNTTGEKYLKDHSIPYRSYDSPLPGLIDVAKGKIDAMVYDAPIMRYWVNSRLKGSVSVLPIIFEKQYYAIALPQHSALRKPINQALLSELTTDKIQETIARYLGDKQ